MERKGYVFEDQNPRKASNIIIQETGDTQVAVGQNYGMPTIFKLKDHLIGVIHPYKKPKEKHLKKVSYFLSLYTWDQAHLERTSSIKLFDSFYEFQLFFIMQLHYDPVQDFVLVIMSNIFGEAKQRATRVFEFNLLGAAAGGKGKSLDKIEAIPYMRSNRYERVIRTMVDLHKHEDGTYFLLAESGYYTLQRSSPNPGAKFLISDMTLWKEIKGIIPMTTCLALQPTCQENIYMFMQSNYVVPVSFVDKKIVQNKDGLYLSDSKSAARFFNIKEVGLRTVAVGYITNPDIQVFRSAEDYRIHAPEFQCFGIVSRETYSKIPAKAYFGDEEEEFESLEPRGDEYEIHTFTDNINGIGIGCYKSKYVSQRLSERRGYAMLGLNIGQTYDVTNEHMLK